MSWLCELRRAKQLFDNLLGEIPTMEMSMEIAHGVFRNGGMGQSKNSYAGRAAVIWTSDASHKARGSVHRPGKTTHIRFF